MSDDWPDSDDFTAVERAAPPAYQWPVTAVCSWSSETPKGQMTVTVAPEVLNEWGASITDRFDIAATEQSGFLFLRITPNKQGSLQLSPPPKRAKTGARGMFRMGFVARSQNVPKFEHREAVYKFSGSGRAKVLMLRIALPERADEKRAAPAKARAEKRPAADKAHAMAAPSFRRAMRDAAERAAELHIQGYTPAQIADDLRTSCQINLSIGQITELLKPEGVVR